MSKNYQHSSYKVTKVVVHKNDGESGGYIVDATLADAATDGVTGGHVFTHEPSQQSAEQHLDAVGKQADEGDYISDEAIKLPSNGQQLSSSDNYKLGKIIAKKRKGF